MKLVLKSRNMRRLMGLKVHHNGFKLTNFLRVAECDSLRKIEVDGNLVVQLKERLEAP